MMRPVNDNDFVTATSPVRIDLLGNWSDHPDFLKLRPSRVINCAVSFDKSDMPVKVMVKKTEEPKVIYRSMDRKSIHEVTFSEIMINPVLKPILDFYPGHDEPSFHTTLSKKGGLYLETEAKVPFRSGLGTSSALVVCCLKALSRLDGYELTEHELAERAYSIERSTGHCGWQDHYASAFRGSILIEKTSLDQPAKVTRLSKYFSQLLEEHAILVYLLDDPHPPIHWDVKGNEDILFKMDDFIDDFLKLERTITVELLMQYLDDNRHFSINFLPRYFSTKYGRIATALYPESISGLIIGSGPAALFVSHDILLIMDKMRDIKYNYEKIFVINI